MLRTLPLFVLLPALAVAAPVPPPSEKEQIAKLWGKTVAGSDKYEFALKGKQLTMRTTGVPARGMLWAERMSMPRVTRTANGDFVATVKVVDAGTPNKDAKHEDAFPGTRAGLLLSGGGYGVEFHLYQQYLKVNGVPRDDLTRCVWVDTWFPGGGAGNRLALAEPGKSTYLRVARTGKDISVSYSFDGKEWSVPYTPRKDLAFPDEVTVGVFLAHSTHQVVEATFDGFTVEKPKAKE